MAKIVKLIDSGDHVKGRYTFVDFNLKCESFRFSKAKEGDNPFNCTSLSMMSPVTVPFFKCMGSTLQRSAQDVRVQGQLRI